jgi:hypothetical protein
MPPHGLFLYYSSIKIGFPPATLITLLGPTRRRKMRTPTSQAETISDPRDSKSRGLGTTHTDFLLQILIDFTEGETVPVSPDPPSRPAHCFLAGLLVEILII